MQTRPSLGDDALWNLHQSYVAVVDPQTMQRPGNELQRMMLNLAGAAARTGTHASEFGGQLKALVSELRGVSDKLMMPAVTQTIESKTRMRGSAQVLESEVKNHQVEIQRLQSELTRVRDETLRDALTLVLNRSGFDLKLSDMLAQPAAPGRSHGRIMFDIDHFKRVNGTHWPVMGDRVLLALEGVAQLRPWQFSGLHRAL